MGAVLGYLIKLYRSNLSYPNGELEQVYDYNQKGRPNDLPIQSIIKRSGATYKYIDRFEPGFVFFLQLIFEVSANWSLVYPLDKVLTPDVVEHINKYGKLVLADNESYDYSFNKIVHLLTGLGVDLDRVVYISASANVDPRVKCFFIDCPSWYNWGHAKIPKADLKVDKTFTVINGRTTSIHKMVFVNKFLASELTECSNYSLLRIDGKERFYSKDVVSRVPIKLDDHDSSRLPGDVGSWPQNLLSGCVTVIPSAHYFMGRERSPYASFPHDCIASVFNLRPFMVLSNFVDFDKAIHSLGYKTYSNIFDESFYSEPDLIKRCNLFIDEMRRIATLDHQMILDETRRINIHNLKNFTSKNKVEKEVVAWLLQEDVA